MSLILALIPLALVIFCFAKESKVTGLYKTFGVYGRFSAYISICFLIAPVALIVGSIITLVTAGEAETANTMALVGEIGFAVVLEAIGVLLYLRMRRKCPPFLRKRLFISLVISGFGVAAKVCLFFLGFVWKLSGPQSVVLGNGQQGYTYNGEVYTADGTHVGSMTGSNEFEVNSNYRRDNY